MKFTSGWLLFLLASTATWAADSGSAPKSPAPAGGGFMLSILPKSFQKNPRLDCNVFTEMTPAGKSRPQPTAEKPEYYIAHTTAAQSRGAAVLEEGPNAITVPQIESMVAQALRPNHYLPASDTSPKPTLVLMIHWGTYSSPAFLGLDQNEAFAEDSGTPRELLHRVLGDVEKRKALIDRAAMVGGVKFASELNDVLNKEVAQRRAADGADTARAQAVEGSDSFSTSGASMLASILESTGPLVMFMNRDAQTERMVDEVFSDCFYVIVSAIDYASLANKQPILIWRTKLTLNSIGVNMRESIPPLVKAGTEHFGRETAMPVVVTRRISREGKVEIGEAQVKEMTEAEPSDQKPAGQRKK